MERKRWLELFSILSFHFQKYTIFKRVNNIETYSQTTTSTPSINPYGTS